MQPMRADVGRSAPSPHVRMAVHGITVSHLSHDYAGFRALDDVSLHIDGGMFLALMGKNGSGKTTLAKHLNGLLKPTAGTVLVDGLDTTEHPVGVLAQHVGFVFQNPDDQIFCSSVRDELEFGPKSIGYTREWAEQLATDSMRLFGLEQLADVAPATLSYGDRRTVALASVLAMDSKTIVLDEPTTGLDRGLSETLLNVLVRLNRLGATVILITHDMQAVARYCSHAAVLNDGHLLGFGTVRDILTDADLLSQAGCTAPLTVRISTALGTKTSEAALTADEFAARFVPGSAEMNAAAVHDDTGQAGRGADDER